MVNFTLPFMTNETISISTLQTLRSWVAIFFLRLSMACLSHSLYNKQWFAHHMNVLFWGPVDFPVKRKGKRSDAFLWQIPISDRQCIGEITKYATITSITQWSRTDWGRLVRVTPVIEPAWLTLGLRAKTFHFLQPPCNWKDRHLKIYK